MSLKYTVTVEKSFWDEGDKAFYNSLSPESKKIQELWGMLAALDKEYKRIFEKQVKLFGEKSTGKWGFCWNDERVVPANQHDCSVGSIRKLRNCVKNADLCCKTCPYFLGGD